MPVSVMSFRNLLDGPHQEAEKNARKASSVFNELLVSFLEIAELMLFLQIFMFVLSKKIKYTHRLNNKKLVFAYRSL